MAVPRNVSRSGKDALGGFAWNALVDICAMEPLASLTPTQRAASLAFWYMNEVNNGGHFQYFCNKEEFDQDEVLRALRDMGAAVCADILEQAIQRNIEANVSRPQNVYEYVESEAEAAMGNLDQRYYAEGDGELMRCLEAHLARYESEFVCWVP